MINLLPPEVKQERSYGRKNIALFGYSAALLATALSTAVIMLLSLQFIGSEEPNLRQNLDADQALVTTLEAEIKSIENIATRLETAKKVSERSVKLSELIPQIGAVLPDGVILNALSLTGGTTDSLQLDVDLKEANLAAVLIRNLVESDLFEAADISSLSPRGSAGDESASESYQFTASLTANFKGTAEAKKKAAAAAASEAAKKAAAEAEAAKTKASDR